jgi:hypothetical protein
MLFMSRSLFPWEKILNGNLHNYGAGGFGAPGGPSLPAQCTKNSIARQYRLIRKDALSEFINIDNAAAEPVITLPSA